MNSILIKPHHFIDIIKLYGSGIDRFVPDEKMGHDFYKVANEIIDKLQKLAIAKYEEKEVEIGNEDLRELERVVMLKVVDQKWMDHIDAMDELKDGIGLRAYGQQDPVVKYRIEGMDMFEEMVLDIKHDVVKILMNIRKQNGDVKRQEAAKG